MQSFMRMTRKSHGCLADGRVLGALKVVKEWCQANSLDPSDLEPHSSVLGFDVSELKTQCERVDEV